MHEINGTLGLIASRGTTIGHGESAGLTLILVVTPGG